MKFKNFINREPVYTIFLIAAMLIVLLLIFYLLGAFS